MKFCIIFVALLTACTLARVDFARAAERQESASPEISNSSQQTQISLYSETYPFFFAGPTIEFQRLRAELFPLNIPVGHFQFTPYVELLHEKYTYGVSNLSVEAGLTHTFDPQTRFLIGVRRTNFNNTENNPWQFRMGLAAGRLKQLRSQLFIEGYAESFLINPNHLQGVVTAEAWAKFGWRAYQQHHFIIDPLLIEARTYQNTRHTIGGRDYLAVTLGPRITYWLAQPNFAASLFFGRSRDWSTAPIQADQWWGIFALGAYF